MQETWGSTRHIKRNMIRDSVTLSLFPVLFWDSLPPVAFPPFPRDHLCCLSLVILALFPCVSSTERPPTCSCCCLISLLCINSPLFGLPAVPVIVSSVVHMFVIYPVLFHVLPPPGYLVAQPANKFGFGHLFIKSQSVSSFYSLFIYVLIHLQLKKIVANT